MTPTPLRFGLAAALATAAWAELTCEGLSMDGAVVAALADRHGVAPRDIRPGGDLLHMADGQFSGLDGAAFRHGFTAICDDLPGRYQGGLADGAVVADDAPPPDLNALPPVARALVVAGLID